MNVLCRRVKKFSFRRGSLCLDDGCYIGSYVVSMNESNSDDRIKLIGLIRSGMVTESFV